MKSFLIITMLLLYGNTINACDICGCGVGGNYIGLLPDFNKRIIGLRYRYNSLQSHVGIGGSATYLTTRENFHTAELWVGWNLSKKVRLMITAPYIFAEKTNQGITRTKNGLGDISLSGFYNAFDKKSPVGGSKLLVQSLWIGGGIKLPSGQYKNSDKSGSQQNTNLFQLGTGSTDIMLQAMYDIRLQDLGLNINSGYKINTGNKYEYSYGNKFSLSTQLYHKFRLGNKSNIAPNAGMLYESSQKDMDKKLEATASGGYGMMGTIGTEYIYKKIMLGFNWQMPLKQNLATGIVKAGNKAMIHIAVAF